MTLEIKPNFKVCGKMFGKNINDYANKLLELKQDDINNLSKGNSITIRFMEENLEITPDMVDIRVSSKEGYDAGSMNNLFIIVDTTLTDDLIKEGTALQFLFCFLRRRRPKAAENSAPP